MPGTLHISLSGIARLARVERPVVSVWRSRAAASDLPFPAACATIGGEERFDVDAVVHWLEASRRGNNSDVRADAAVLALPAGVDLRGNAVLFEGLTALLCLQAVSGADLEDLSASAVLELADEVDAEDTLLRREVAALGTRVATMASYAHVLADAAFGSAQAFEELLAQRYRHNASDAVRSSLAEPARALVSALAVSLVRESGSEPPTYVDPTGVGSDLLLHVLLAEAESAPDVVTLANDAPSGRLFRRRVRTHGHLISMVADRALFPVPAVLVAQLPVSGRTDMPVEEMLDVVDDIAMSMDDRQRAVVVGPSSLLTDRIRDRSLEQLRSRVLRSGRVRAMLRLPPGLVVHRSRQALALWVLGPDLEEHALEDRRIAIIDVSDEELTELLISQVRDDVIAAMAPPDLTRAHSFSRARLRRTSSVLAERRDLVAPSSATTRGDLDPAALAVRIEALRTSSEAAADPLAGARLSMRDSPAMSPILIGDATRQRLVRVIAGNRQGFDTTPTGSVPVIGVPELVELSPLPDRWVDRFTFLGTNEAARLTEPGDVVFCTSPRPRALVDEAGGAAVQYPARVLRIDVSRGEGLSPYVVAQTINARSPSSRAWKTWPLPRVRADQVVPVTEALRAVHREQLAVRARLAELDDLQSTLVTATSCGSFALTMPTDDHDTEDN